MKLLQQLEEMATAMAAHGHGFVGSGEARPCRARLGSVQAVGVHYRPKQARKRGWEGRGGSWPHGAPTPARSRHGGGGRNGEYALTKPQTTRQKGRGGRGDHGEARGKMADAFLQWRACKVMAKLGQEWRSCCGLSLRAVEAKEMQMKRRVRWVGGCEFKACPAVPGHPWRMVARAEDQ